jgi:hypothetical protein
MLVVFFSFLNKILLVAKTDGLFSFVALKNCLSYTEATTAFRLGLPNIGLVCIGDKGKVSNQGRKLFICHLMILVRRQMYEPTVIMLTTRLSILRDELELRTVYCLLFT